MSGPAKKKRKGLSARTRFEIFKRDRFMCLYCGATPASGPLHIDHVTPVAEGGKNNPDNLVTACGTCNLGKGAVPLKEHRIGVGFAKEEDREHAEQIREWLALQKEIEAERRVVIDSVARSWVELLGHMSQEMYDRLPRLLQAWSPNVLRVAMAITAKKFRARDEYDYGHALKQQKYFSAILRNWKEEGGVRV